MAMVFGFVQVFTVQDKPCNYTEEKSEEKETGKESMKHYAT